MNAVATDWRFFTDGNTQRRYLSDDELEVSAKAPAPATSRMPDWLQTVLPRLMDLVQLKDDWDSYGARRPSVESATSILAVLNSVMDAEIVAPSIVPTPEGHFQAEWHRNGGDLEVEVIDPTRILVSFAATGAAPWEDEISVDFTRLIAAVRRVGGTP
jgi:hypothetical protein